MPSVFRITVAENIVIPSASEMIIPAKVEAGTAHITRGIVDQTRACELNGLLVAKTAVDPSFGTVPVRVLNLSGEEQQLQADTQIAFCHAIRDIEVVNQCGHSTQRG